MCDGNGKKLCERDKKRELCINPCLHCVQAEGSHDEVCPVFVASCLK